MCYLCIHNDRQRIDTRLFSPQHYFTFLLFFIDSSEYCRRDGHRKRKTKKTDTMHTRGWDFGDGHLRQDASRANEQSWCIVKIREEVQTKIKIHTWKLARVEVVSAMHHMVFPVVGMAHDAQLNSAFTLSLERITTEGEVYGRKNEPSTGWGGWMSSIFCINIFRANFFASAHNVF